MNNSIGPRTCKGNQSGTYTNFFSKKEINTWRAITPVQNWVIGWAVIGRASIVLYTWSAVTRNLKLTTNARREFNIHIKMILYETRSKPKQASTVQGEFGQKSRSDS